MKLLKSYKIGVIALMMFYSNHIWAQSNNNDIPQNVTSAFAAKYPGVNADKWRLTDNGYAAKAKIEGHTYTVDFDKTGNWVQSSTKINWPWKLPAAIKTGFNNTKYKNWNMYSVRLIDKPSGRYYQITVNDANHPVDAFHQEQYTDTRLVELRSDGEYVKDEHLN